MSVQFLYKHSATTLTKSTLHILTNHILQYQIPADRECHKLAHSHIAVHVRRSRFGHTRGKLRIAEASEGRRHRGHNKRQRHCRTGLLVCDRTSQNVDTEAEGAADAQQRQIEQRQNASEFGFVAGAVIALATRQRLPELLHSVHRVLVLATVVLS